MMLMLAAFALGYAVVSDAAGTDCFRNTKGCTLKDLKKKTKTRR